MLSQGTPGLKRHELHNPGAYVVDRDLAGIRGLVQTHGAELAQLRARDVRGEQLSKVSWAIVVLLSAFRGLRGGRDGCGLQLPIALWASILGVSERAVQYGFEQLRAHGVAWHRRRLVKVSWIDRNGVERERADVYGVAYLSQLGALRLSRSLGGGTRQIVVRNGRQARALFAAGVVGKLLRTLSEKLRAIALRVTDAFERFTPTAGSESLEDLEQKKRGKPVENRRGRPPPRDRPPWAPPDDSPAAGLEKEQLRLYRLHLKGELTPQIAWPDAWAAAPDDRARRYLCREAERAIEAFSARELRWRLARGELRA
jgi:hypothetical protein